VGEGPEARRGRPLEQGFGLLPEDHRGGKENEAGQHQEEVVVEDRAKDGEEPRSGERQEKQPATATVGDPR
jgi:hypothetical protein